MTEPLLIKLAAERPALTVSQLTQQVKQLLEGQFANLWIRGEISNFKRHTSGHWYFTLKDANAQLSCACFRMQNRLIRFGPEDGIDVYARGRLSVYEKRGDYQLIVEFMEPVGVGSLQLAFEQLKARLQAEGLFDQQHKKPLPLLPRRVGIVTSRTGAAVQDMLRVLGRRNSSVSILLCPVQVQGDGAAKEIAQGIEVLNRRDDVDVIIVGRGGGSIEDLWAFNEEVVARAIFASRIPIISAVGHETDFTIADFVADVRAPTPSAAAELVAARRDDLVATISGLHRRLVKAAHLNLATLRHRVSELQARRGFDQATGLLQQYILRVDDLDHRMQMVMAAMLKMRRERFVRASRRMAAIRLRERLAQLRGRLTLSESKLQHLIRRRTEAARRAFNLAASKLDALSPLAVLGRGYAIVRGPQGEIVRKASEVERGDRLRVNLAEGQVTCVAEEVS
jgi:exodeoxyribonuclease VII large subunit